MAGRSVSKPVSKRRNPRVEYVDGNTVRKLEPERISEPIRRRDSRTGSAVRRNQEKALQMNVPYLLMLMAAMGCMLYICVSYIHIQSDMSARMNSIKGLEQELAELKTQNDALETQINTFVDLDHIYKVATEELGMVYANKDQVLLYNRTESEYVRQYEDIPNH